MFRLNSVSGLYLKFLGVLVCCLLTNARSVVAIYLPLFLSLADFRVISIHCTYSHPQCFHPNIEMVFDLQSFLSRLAE